MVKDNSPISEQQNQHSTNPLSSAATKSLTDFVKSLSKEQLTNQDLFDLWLTASLEETSLLGKVGPANASKLQKVTQSEVKKIYLK